MAQLRRWWVQKYKLPATHELFLGQPLAVLNLEMLEDLWLRERELEQKVEDSDGPESVEAERQLAEVHKALGIGLETAKGSGIDPLIDKWESEIAEGKDPDLNEGVRNG
jgi:hypothetical protein